MNFNRTEFLVAWHCGVTVVCFEVVPGLLSTYSAASITKNAFDYFANCSLYKLVVRLNYCESHPNKNLRLTFAGLNRSMYDNQKSAIKL